MSPSAINFRNLIAIITLFFALAISMLPIVTPAAPSLATVRIIDSSGSKISSIYYGLMPDPRFANQLGVFARRNTAREDSSHAFRSLTNDRLKSRCNLLAAAFRGPRAVAPRPASCNGQYMEPQWYDCLGCDPSNYYLRFYSTGTQPCDGYYYPNLIGDCQGCEIAERDCHTC